jgi:C-type mannose receptor
MKLAQSTSATKNQILMNASSQQIIWLGLNDIREEGTYTWCDGSSSSYTAWAPGEPNDNSGQEDCATLTKPDGLWNDLRCSELHAFICEP